MELQELSLSALEALLGVDDRNCLGHRFEWGNFHKAWHRGVLNRYFISVTRQDSTCSAGTRDPAGTFTSNSLGLWRDIGQPFGREEGNDITFVHTAPVDCGSPREPLDAKARRAFGVSFSACRLARCMYFAPVSFSSFRIHCTEPTWCWSSKFLISKPSSPLQPKKRSQSDSRTRMLALIALEFPSPIHACHAVGTRAPN